MPTPEETKKAHEWLIISRGLYFRPDAKGYTGIRDEAGRYDQETAMSYVTGSGGTVSTVKEHDAEEFLPAAHNDLVIKHLIKQRDEARAALRQNPQGDAPISYFHLANGYPHNNEVDQAIEYLEGDGKHTSFDSKRIWAENVLLDHAKAVRKEAQSPAPQPDTVAEIASVKAEVSKMMLWSTPTAKHVRDQAHKIVGMIDALTARKAVDVEALIRECQHDARKQSIKDDHIRAVIEWVFEYHADHLAATSNINGQNDDNVTLPRSFFEEIWTIAQEIGYHAEMDTIKGKRRGHWILPKALEIIKAVGPYRPAPAADDREA